MAVKHTSEVNFNIGLDENKVPEEISWTDVLRLQETVEESRGHVAKFNRFL